MHKAINCTWETSQEQYLFRENTLTHSKSRPLHFVIHNIFLSVVTLRFIFRSNFRILAVAKPTHHETQLRT